MSGRDKGCRIGFAFTAVGTRLGSKLCLNYCLPGIVLKIRPSQGLELKRLLIFFFFAGGGAF